MEIGRLTAVFDADTKKFEAGGQRAETVLKGLASETGLLSGKLGGLEKLFGSVGGGASSMAGQITVAASALGALASAEVAVAVGLFNATKAASDWGSKIHDAAQESGTSAETISTLAYAAKLSGRDITDATTAMKKFGITLGEGARGSKEAQAALTRLGIDPKKGINDLDGAMAKAFKTIHSAGSGIAQVNLAADAFGKRSGPNMISVIETMNGDFAAFRKEARDVGAELSTTASNAADVFGDKLDRVTERVRFLGLSFGASLVPQATQALDIVDRVISQLPATTTAVGSAIQQDIETYILRPLRLTENILNALERPRTLALNLVINGPGAIVSSIFGGALSPKADFTQDIESLSGGAGIFRKKDHNTGGGGGGRGGGSPKEDPGVKLMKQLQDDLARLHGRTKAQEIEEQLLGKEYNRTSDAMKKQAILLGREIDDVTEILKLTRKRRVESESLITVLEREAMMTQELDVVRQRFAQTMRNTRTHRFAETPPEGERDLIGLGGGSFALRESIRSTRELLTSSRPRLATSTREIMQAQLAEIREEMSALGDDLTDVFSRSIYDGFHEGAMRGLAEFGLGLERIVEQNFANKMMAALSDVLSGAASGGGFWSGFLKALGFGSLKGLGGVAGGVGLPGAGGIGSAATAIGRASGGPIWPGQLYKVHQDEHIVPLAPGYVIPRGGMGMGQQTGQQRPVVNLTINLPKQASASYNTPRSTAQQAEAIWSVLAAHLR